MGIFYILCIVYMESYLFPLHDYNKNFGIFFPCPVLLLKVQGLMIKILDIFKINWYQLT